MSTKTKIGNNSTRWDHLNGSQTICESAIHEFCMAFSCIISYLYIERETNECNKNKFYPNNYSYINSKG